MLGLQLSRRARHVRLANATTAIRAASSTSKGGKPKAKVQSAKDASEGVSYTRGLFLGVNNAKLAFPFPKLSTDESETLQSLVNPVVKFFEEGMDAKLIDDTKVIPEETLASLKEMGLFGLQIPEELNGLGLSNTGYARVCEELSDASIAVTIMAHQSIGLKGILLNGNAAQQAKYLPKLATGENLAAFALTEPSSGSDAQSIKTRAVLSEDKSHFILNGGKIWISNGGWAEVMTVFAQTEVDGKDKVTAFIVERAFGGLTSGPPEDKLGIRGSNTCQVFFDNVKVPVENVLGGGEDGKAGGLAGVGHGFKVAMNILNNGRFGIGAASGGQLRRVIAKAAEHATQRKQFGASLSEFGLIKEKIGHLALNTYAIETAGERLSAVGSLFKNPFSDPAAVASEISSRVQKKISSPATLEGVHPKLKASADLLQTRTIEFGDAVESLLRKHGKTIVHEQLQLKRIADASIQLFAMTATISRASTALTDKSPTAAHELALTQLYAEIASDKIRNNLREIQTHTKKDSQLKAIADQVFAQSKYIPSHPTGVNA
ncbi:hypothetical protein DYB38_005258 [Aphanomyces astaci]|uniref:Acyl-CoA dehydrogenase n=1 Tax=Aphanomyces astaci TaxID=112090 RepID=A0A397BZ00_APHAT|nr:hypothetical protein DYB38_005258 [Aphanomyces astaci]